MSTARDVHISINLTKDEAMGESQIQTLMQKLETTLSNGSLSIRDVHVTNSFTERSQSEGDQPHSPEVLREVKRAAMGVVARTRVAQGSPDAFSFQATIMTSGQPRSEVCVKLDTGSRENWISGRVVDRAGLRDQIVPIGEAFYVAANNSLFNAVGTVSVEWTRDSIKSWQTKFLVLEDASYDLLLGSIFIIDEGLFIFNDAEPVLVNTRLAPLSKGKQPFPSL